MKNKQQDDFVTWFFTLFLYLYDLHLNYYLTLAMTCSILIVGLIRGIVMLFNGDFDIWKDVIYKQTDDDDDSISEEIMWYCIIIGAVNILYEIFTN